MVYTYRILSETPRWAYCAHHVCGCVQYIKCRFCEEAIPREEWTKPKFPSYDELYQVGMKLASNTVHPTRAGPLTHTQLHTHTHTHTHTHNTVPPPQWLRLLPAGADPRAQAPISGSRGAGNDEI